MQKDYFQITFNIKLFQKTKYQLFNYIFVLILFQEP